MNGYLIGLNAQVVGKCSPHQLSHPGAWSPRRVTLPQLADHIRAGHPWMPSTLDGNGKRWQTNANHAEVLGLDIDEGMSIQDAIAHPFIAAHCGVLIESASSTPQHNKFRLVFALPQPVEGWEKIRLCNRYLAHVVGSADPACKDASRFFFGAPGRSPHLLQAVTLPPSFVQDAIAWGEALEAQERQRAEMARQQWEALKATGEDTDALLLAALDHIPPDCDYNDWIAVGMALAGMGDSWFHAWDSWSAGAANYKPREMQGRWRSFRGASPAPGVVLGIAKRYGWQIPRSKRDPLEAFTRRSPKRAPKPAPAGPSVIYSPGGRLAAWARALQQQRMVLDVSAPGMGKSFDSGLIDPEAFGVERLIYVSAEHRNPTTDTLTAANGWVDLEARHSGLIRDERGKLRRASQRQPQYTVSPNCGRSRLAAVLRDKNIHGADTAGRLCGGCPLRETCQHTRGYGYGFLYERRNALSAPKLRCHPDSLPHPDDFDYTNTLILWDEPESSLNPTRTINVSQGDVEAAIARLAIADSLSPELLAVFEFLLNGMTGETDLPRYGLPLEALRERLGKVPNDMAIARAAAALSPDRDLEPILNPTADHGVDIADLPKQLRRAFTERDHTASEEAQATVLKQWLGDFFAILQGQRGHLTLTRYGLRVEVPQHRHRAILQAAAGAIFLDATMPREHLALALGIAPDGIATVGQVVPKTDNLNIIQVADMGRMGQQRGTDKAKRLEALISHYRATDPTTAVIDFKKFDADGAWWRDSRGVNDFEGCNTLILAGTPCPNLNAVLATYATLTGDTDTEGDGFADFLEAKIRSEFTQAIGRLRAHRRGGDRLQVVVVSDADIGHPAQQVEAVTITPEAGSKTQRVELAIKGAIATLQAQGRKVTQTAIAALANISQGYVSRFREIITFLLESLNRKVITPPGGAGVDRPTIAALLAAVVDAAPDQGSLLAGLADLLEMAISPYELARCCDRLPIPHQQRFIMALTPLA